MILQTLEVNRERYISGQDLANRLGVSRGAVWNAISALRRGGHVIDAYTHTGYRLASSSGKLSAPGIAPHLRGPAAGASIRVHNALDSTNTAAKRMILAGGEPGAVIIAESQSEGRGRLGRGFFSPPSGSLYMSFVLKAPEDFSEGRLVTVAAAVAVSRAVEAFVDSRCQIKWVNDVIVDGKKICGILTEGVSELDGGGIGSLALGIGLNVNVAPEDFPEYLRGKAGSITLPPSSRCRLAAEIINQVFALCADIRADEIIRECRERSFLTGKRISVVAGKAERDAVALGINDDGSLRVEYGDGARADLVSGEISIKF
jgi:BirA family biotin operon repressor/biotin-[acetyl-CoA-carboxylase] ligase